MRNERYLSLALSIAVAAVVGLPNRAEAQAWLSDRSRTEGPGFRVGDFELHPGLGVEIGYDSNLYYTSDDPPAGSPEGTDSGILRATAHLMFATRGAERRAEGESGGTGTAGAQPDVTFRGGLSGSFYTFFNDLDRSNMEIDASLALGILPGRTVSFQITEQFGRSIRPFTENTRADASYGRIQNDAGLLVNFATSGDVLRISAGYNFQLDFFEDQLFQYGNRFVHVLSLRESFRFLPQTAIVHDTSVRILDYFNEGAPAAASRVSDGVLINTRVGLNGAFTTNFSVLAAVGYGAGFFSGTPTYEQEYESVVAQIEARWQISEPVRLVFGYDRGFDPSFIGNYYQRDRGYAAFQAIIDGSFLIGVDASLAYYNFGAIVTPGGMMLGDRLEREDIRLIASIFAEYRFTEWLGVNATLRYTGNFTDFRYNIPVVGGGTVVDPAQFNKFEAWGGVRVFY